jgi:predicted amidohydrolase YtcJ
VPDLLVLAPIVTCDPARPRAEAAVVRSGAFVRVGSRAECAREAGPGTVRLEAGGATPGFGDAHGHVALLGRWMSEVRCSGAASAAECGARAAERARQVPPGTWIRGNGWDQTRWPEGRFPTAAALTAAVPRHPVALSRVDAHALWVNEAALAAADIDARTPDPPGGRILRDESGHPSGVLLDAAQDLVLERIPPPGPRELEAALLRGLDEIVRRGITSVHDAGVPDEVLAIYRRLAAEDRLPVRVCAMLEGERPVEELGDLIRRAGARPPPGGSLDARLSVRAVKLFADGALGSRGAALHEDYADDPGNRGLLLSDPETLAARVAAVCAAGFQPAVHAIGDRAVTVVLDALDAAAARGIDVAALRPRIEHLQIVLQRHLPRLVRLGVVASVQPLHLAADGAWVPARLGEGTERLRGAYAYVTLRDAGVPLAFGSDFPVVDPDPLGGLAAAETRTAAEGLALSPEERLSRAESLAAFTTGAAYAAFAEGRRGMVREGMDADLTLFDGDVGACDASELCALKATHTIVGGRVEQGKA